VRLWRAPAKEKAEAGWEGSQDYFRDVAACTCGAGSHDRVLRYFPRQAMAGIMAATIAARRSGMEFHHLIATTRDLEPVFPIGK
jgi:hypothetical protein